MHEATIIDRHGNRRKAKLGEVLQDGETMHIHVATMMMDAAPPGTVSISDSATRADLVRKAEIVAGRDLNCTGKSDAAVMRDALRWRFGDAYVADSSDAEVTGMFKVHAADGRVEAADAYAAYKNSLQHGGIVSDQPLSLADAQAKAATARAIYIEQLGNAWRRPAA